MIAAQPLSGQARFEDHSQPAGIANVGFNRGVSVVDYDRDGWDDLYFTRLMGANFLYRNTGDGRFEDAGQAAGLAHTGNSISAVWGDLDNDGWPDMVLGNRNEPCLVFRNNGDGSFSDMTFSSAVQHIAQVQSVQLADVNNDGWLDIYFANLGTENALFLNLGNGQFKDATQESGALDNQMSMGAVFFDYDNDGDQDLYLSHDADQPNILYRNDGSGHFEDVSVESGTNYAGQGMGVDAADFNNDGYLDLYITNLYENTLYLNNKDGTFSDVSAQANVTDPGMGWGTAGLDYDNDGYIDLYVCNESYFPVHGEFYQNILYRNLGQGNFAVSSSGTVLESPYGGYGVSFGDFDRNGKLDIAIANSSPADGNQLLINQEDNGHHWLGLVLEGSLSNRSAIGARIEVRAGQLRLSDQLMAGNGFASQHSSRLHFGLAQATQIDRLDIYWPAGGHESFEQLAVDQVYHITEQGGITSAARPLPAPAAALRIFPNPTRTELTFEPKFPDQTTKWRFRLMDARGKLYLHGQGRQGGRRHSLNLPGHFPEGLYFLEVTSNNLRLVGKFVLDR